MDTAMPPPEPSSDAVASTSEAEPVISTSTSPHAHQLGTHATPITDLSLCSSIQLSNPSSVVTTSSLPFESSTSPSASSSLENPEYEAFATASSSPASSGVAPISLESDEGDLVGAEGQSEVGFEQEFGQHRGVYGGAPVSMAMPRSKSPVDGPLSSTPTATLRSNVTLKQNYLDNRINVVDVDSEGPGQGMGAYLDVEFGVFARPEDHLSVEVVQATEDRLEVVGLPDVPPSVRASFMGTDAESPVPDALSPISPASSATTDHSLSTKRNTRLERWLEQQSDLWVAPPALSNSTSTTSTSSATSVPLSTPVSEALALAELEREQALAASERESVRISGHVNSAATFALKRKESLREKERLERDREDVVTPTPGNVHAHINDAGIAGRTIDRADTAAIAHSPTSTSVSPLDDVSPLLATSSRTPLTSPPTSAGATTCAYEKLSAGYPTPSFGPSKGFKQIAPTLITPASAAHLPGHQGTIPNLLGGVLPLSSASISSTLGAKVSLPLPLKLSKPEPSPLLVPSTPSGLTLSFPGSAASSRRNSHNSTIANGDPPVAAAIPSNVLKAQLSGPEIARADSPLLGWSGAALDIDVDKPLPPPPSSSSEVSSSPPTTTLILSASSPSPLSSSVAAQYQLLPATTISPYAAGTSPLPTTSRTLAPTQRPQTAPHQNQSRMSLSPATSPFTSPNISPMMPAYVPSSLAGNGIGGVYGRHSPNSHSHSSSGSGNFTHLPIGVNPGSSFTTSGFGGQTHSRSGSGTSSPARRYSHQTLPHGQTQAHSPFAQHNFGVAAPSPPGSNAPSRKGSILRGVREEDVDPVEERLQDLQGSNSTKETRPSLAGLRSRSYSTTLTGSSGGYGMRPSTTSGMGGGSFAQPPGFAHIQPAPTPTTSPTAQFHLPTGMLHKSRSLAQLSVLANVQPLTSQAQQPTQQQQTPLPPSSPPTRRTSRVPQVAPLGPNSSPPTGSKSHSYNSSVVSLAGLVEEDSFISDTSTLTAIQVAPLESDPTAPLAPTRNAVYIDSEDMREKLDQLLEMARLEMEEAESSSMHESTEGEDDTIEGLVDNWTYSYSNSHSRSNSVPLSRSGSLSGYGSPYGGLRKGSTPSSSSEKPINVPSTPPSTVIRSQAQQYTTPTSNQAPPPNTPMTAYFSADSGSPASTAAAPSSGGFYMNPEASSSQIYVGSGSSGAHSRTASKENTKGAGVLVGMTTTVNTNTALTEAKPEASRPTPMNEEQESSSETPVRPSPAPPLDLSEVVGTLAAIATVQNFGGSASGSEEFDGDAYGGFEEEESVGEYDGEGEGEGDMSTSDEEMIDEALALARDLGVDDRMVFNGRRSLEGMYEDAEGWEEFEDEEMGVGMVDVDVRSKENRYATAKRRSILGAGFSAMVMQSGSGSLRRKGSVRRTSVASTRKNGSVNVAASGGSLRRRGSNAAGRGRSGSHLPNIAVRLGNSEDMLDGVVEDEEFGHGNSLAPPSRWSLESSVQDEQREGADSKPGKKKRRSFVPFVGNGDKEKDKDREDGPTTISPNQSTGKKRNRLASFISRLSGVGVGGTVGSPTLMAAAMAASSSPASAQLTNHASFTFPMSFSDKNGSGLLPSPVIVSHRDTTPPPPVPVSPTHTMSSRGLSIDVQAAANYVPDYGSSKSVPNSPPTRSSTGIVPSPPSRPVPTPPGIPSLPSSHSFVHPKSSGFQDSLVILDPPATSPGPAFGRTRSNSAADLLSMRRPSTSHNTAFDMASPDHSSSSFARRPALMKSASASVLNLHQPIRRQGDAEATRPATPSSIASTDEYVRDRNYLGSEHERWEAMKKGHEERWLKMEKVDLAFSPTQPSPEVERTEGVLNSLSPHVHLQPAHVTKQQTLPPSTRPRLKSMTSLAALPSPNLINGGTLKSKGGFRGLVERMRGNSSAASTGYNSPASQPSTPNFNNNGPSSQPAMVDDYDLFAPGPDPFARETPTPTHSPSASLSVTTGPPNPGGLGGILGRKPQKRKLIVTGVGMDDIVAYEAVKSWCESFGELREVTRAPNGAMFVDFRKASVADTVCRLQAQVYIRGAGSVALSWSTKKRPT